MLYSISLSIMSRRQDEYSAIARQGEGNNGSVNKKMELLTGDVNGWV